MQKWAAMGAALALAACAMTSGAPDADDAEPSPFPVARGTLAPPPAAAAHAPPPEGVAAGGVDFGRWRSADPAVYAPALQAQVSRRYSGRDVGAIRADLEANGFTCEDAQRLDCRIEIMERQCAFDWYVVLAPGVAEPVAGFDVMCLGAR